MILTELLSELMKQKENKGGFLIHLNSDDLDPKTQYNTDIQFSDLCFSNFTMLRSGTLLAFENSNREPISHADDGTPLYAIDTDGSMYIDLTKVEDIEKVKDGQDWFQLSTHLVVNLYMFPANNSIDGHRNVVTIGFME